MVAKFRTNVDPSFAHYLKEPTLSAYKAFMKLVLANPGLPCEADPERWTADTPAFSIKDRCLPCAIFHQCREYALKDSSATGVWGGLDDKERAARRRADKINDTPA
jgi:hypothetical protein